MTVLEAILLGIVQGLTEFLPISSTAHLTLAAKALNLIDPENPGAWTAFIAVMQLGTLFAVIVFFFGTLVEIGESIVTDTFSQRHRKGQRRFSTESRIGFAVVIGTIPVAIAGLAGSDVIHSMFTKSTPVIASSLVILALFLWLAERRAKHVRTVEGVTFQDALLVGAAQALALIPGASRSGTTITAALFLGFTRQAAARFSFLLSIPAVFASGVYEMRNIDPGVFSLGVPQLIIATLSSAVSGYVAIAWLLKFLANHTTMIFVWYRIALGLSLVSMVLAGWIKG